MRRERLKDDYLALKTNIICHLLYKLSLLDHACARIGLIPKWFNMISNNCSNYFTVISKFLLRIHYPE